MKTYSLLAYRIVSSSALCRIENNLHKFYVRKEADTIEELCDKFVYIDDGCEPEVSDELDLMQTSTTIIYGAVWTDRGLIYVAKMNNKGELELL